MNLATNGVIRIKDAKRSIGDCEAKEKRTTDNRQLREEAKAHKMTVAQWKKHLENQGRNTVWIGEDDDIEIS